MESNKKKTKISPRVCQRTPTHNNQTEEGGNKESKGRGGGGGMGMVEGGCMVYEEVKKGGMELTGTKAQIGVSTPTAKTQELKRRATAKERRTPTRRAVSRTRRRATMITRRGGDARNEDECCRDGTT